jgi:3-oxoacyl-[acyl-carrier protein] reductase
MSQNNRITLVTGASRGIGRAIALAFGRSNCTVIGTATTDEGASKITAAFAAEGIKGEGIMLNVTAMESVNNAFSLIKDKYGAPEILINNAAITQDNLLLRMKENEWSDVIETNLNAIYRLSKACLRDMVKARWGRIINISSIVGSTGNAGQVNYAAAKAGLIGFTKSLAQEIASREITVNAVAPGFIETDMTGVLPESQRELLLQKIPMQRLGSPDEVASAVLFLASDAAAYITGQTLHVNGGMYMP